LPAPIGGRPLSLLEETLAATETGTQCRNCWKFLRRLKPAPRLARVTALRPARSVARLRPAPSPFRCRQPGRPAPFPEGGAAPFLSPPAPPGHSPASL